jgi:probable HAF family extracellular repeat protein
VIVGSVDLQPLEMRAVVWTNGKPRELGALGKRSPEDPVSSGASSINDKGEIVGWAEVSPGVTHGFLYSNGRMRDLGTLGGLNSNAVRINARGQIAGGSDTGERHSDYTLISHATLWDGGKAKDLGSVPGFSDSYAADLNNKGDVVGLILREAPVRAEAGQRAFLYRNGRMVNLNDMIPKSSGWLLLNATGINDRGQIVGWGLLRGKQHAYLLEPDAKSGTSRSGVDGKK